MLFSFVSVAVVFKLTQLIQVVEHLEIIIFFRKLEILVYLNNTNSSSSNDNNSQCLDVHYYEPGTVIITCFSYFYWISSHSNPVRERAQEIKWFVQSMHVCVVHSRYVCKCTCIYKYIYNTDKHLSVSMHIYVCNLEAEVSFV